MSWLTRWRNRRREETELDREVRYHFERHVTYDHEIVGVVKGVKYRNLRQEVPRTVYFAAFQSRQAAGTFVVRTAAPPAAMRGSLQGALDRVDRRLRVGEMLSLDEHVARSVLRERMLAALAGFFGFLALVLASVGIYGVMAFQVARRRREIGIRMALGARPGAVVGMVLGQVARLVLAGTALGMAAALGITGVAEKLLFGVAPTDPLTFALAAGVLATVAIGASYLPGRVASRLNPVDTLRLE